MKKVLTLFTLLLIMPVMVSASPEEVITTKDNSEIKLTETKWKNNGKELTPGIIIEKNPAIKASKGGSNISFKVTINDGNGKAITDAATLELIKSLMVYEVDTSKTYTKEELKKLTHYNKDLTLTSKSNVLTFKYEKSLKENDSVTLFNYIVIPNDLTQTELELLSDFQIVIEPVIDSVAKESILNNPVTGIMLKLGLIIVLLAIASFALYLIYKREQKKAGLMVILFALVLTSAGIINTKADTSTKLVNEFAMEKTINSPIKFSSSSSSLSLESIAPNTSTTTIASNAIINSNTNSLNSIIVEFSENDTAEYSLYVRNEGEETIYLNDVVWNNVDGKNSNKVCTALEATNQSLVNSACNGIYLTIVYEYKNSTIQITPKSSLNEIRDNDNNLIDAEELALEPGESKEIIVQINYFPSTISDGPFKVEFGDIDFINSDGTEEYKLSIQDLIVKYTPQSSLKFSSSKTSLETKEIVGVIATPSTVNPATINNSGIPTISGIGANFKAKSEASYEVYIRNDGEYDAYLNEIKFNNVSGKDAHKICTPEEGTTQSLLDQTCEDMYMMVCSDVFMGCFESSQETDNIKLEAGQSTMLMIYLTFRNIDTPIEADGIFNVQFGDIEIDYSTGRNAQRNETIKIETNEIMVQG